VFEDSEALYKAMRKALSDMPMPTHEEIMQMIHEQQETVAAFITALDQLASADKSLVNWPNSLLNLRPRKRVELQIDKKCVEQ